MEVTRFAIAMVLVAACGKSERGGVKKETEPTPTTEAPPVAAKIDPACEAKVKELAPWLAQHEVETASREIDFGYTLAVIDRLPSPVAQVIDTVFVTPKNIAIYDASEANHVGGLGENAKQEEVEAKLAAAFAQKPDPKKDRDAAPADTLRIDIDRDATWTDAARVLAAVQKAGYKTATLVFTATSKLAAPAGLPAQITDDQASTKAMERTRELKKKCAAWDDVVFKHKTLPNKADDARSMGADVAAAIGACNCAVDPDEVRALAWTESHWHQARVRVGVPITLGEGAKLIELPGATTWTAASEQILAAAPEGSAPPAIAFVAK